MNPMMKRSAAAASMINVNTFAPSRSMLMAATTTRRTAKPKQMNPRFCIPNHGVRTGELGSANIGAKPTTETSTFPGSQVSPRRY